MVYRCSSALSRTAPMATMERWPSRRCLWPTSEEEPASLDPRHESLWGGCRPGPVNSHSGSFLRVISSCSHSKGAFWVDCCQDVLCTALLEGCREVPILLILTPVSRCIVLRWACNCYACGAASTSGGIFVPPQQGHFFLSAWLTRSRWSVCLVTKEECRAP